MARTRGRPDVQIGLIDGPVALQHPALVGAQIRAVSDRAAGLCSHAASPACRHGTFIAGLLCAQGRGPVPAICPACTLRVYPIFAEPTPGGGARPQTTPEHLAAAILACLEAGVQVLNLTAVFSWMPHNTRHGHTTRVHPGW
jgi:hypothetical protein